MKQAFILTAGLCISGFCACNSAEPAQEVTVPTSTAVSIPTPVNTTTVNSKAKEKVKASPKKDNTPQQKVEKNTQQTINSEMMVS